MKTKIALNYIVEFVVDLGGLFLLATAVAAGDGKLSGDRIPSKEGDIIIHPVNHASLALEWKGQIVYIDPVGGAKRYEGLPRPDVILLTHSHFDHFDPETLKGVAAEKTVLVAPRDVFEKLSGNLETRAKIMTNGEVKTVDGIKVEAVPMYNTTPDRMKFHKKGAGNGYVLTLGDKRIYISGDTEDIPEMRALKNIDVAFVCMNLPYTMTVEQAASAVREFHPKIVYPYHSKGSDLEKFKQRVGTDAGVEVRLRNWY